MKVLCCLCLLISTVVTATNWLSKRDVHHSDSSEGMGGSDCSDPRCANIFEPIRFIADTPRLDLLVVNESLTLDCSKVTLEEAEKCSPAVVRDCSAERAAKKFLMIFWEYFCKEKTDVEGLSGCFSSPELIPHIMTCTRRMSESSDYSATLHCVFEQVSSLAECGATGGRVFRELLSQLYAVLFPGGPGRVPN